MRSDAELSFAHPRNNITKPPKLKAHRLKLLQALHDCPSDTHRVIEHLVGALARGAILVQLFSFQGIGWREGADGVEEGGAWDAADVEVGLDELEEGETGREVWR